jgi:hypothetical protein
MATVTTVRATTCQPIARWSLGEPPSNITGWTGHKPISESQINREIERQADSRH